VKIANHRKSAGLPRRAGVVNQYPLRRRRGARTVSSNSSATQAQESYTVLWSSIAKPQRLMPFGVATMPVLGRGSYHTDEQSPNRWRD
jgi:hypothetical protein